MADLKLTVQQRAKALEDWAVTTLGNTTELSSEAEQALRHHGTKGLFGRAFTFTVGDADDVLFLRGHLAGVFVSTQAPLRIIVLVPAGHLVFNDGSRIQNAAIMYITDTDGEQTIGWVLADDSFDPDKAVATHDSFVVTLDIA